MGIKNNTSVMALAGQVNDLSEIKSAGFCELHEISCRNTPLEIFIQKNIAAKNLEKTLQKINFQQYL